jgi:putative phosphoribosyl transferase
VLNGFLFFPAHGILGADMLFASREQAGFKLGQHLLELNIQADLVMGLPRGGVVVAAEVARMLHLPLGVIVVRKVGHPRHREFAVGALAEGDVVLLDTSAMEKTNVLQDELDQVISEEKERLREYQVKFGQTHTSNFAERTVLIVDDGLATGATTEAAVISARNRKARKVYVAVPVASDNAFERISRVADQVFTLVVDPDFDAVGRYYQQFSQTTDEEVLTLLSAHRNLHFKTLGPGEGEIS